MHILYIGLGKMGGNMVERLLEKGYIVTAYDADTEARARAASNGVAVVDSLEALMQTASATRTIWIMVPHHVVDTVLDALAPHLTPGDTVIEAGNSPFRETVRRAAAHTARGVAFLDAGISGGPSGARDGACIMVGGDKAVYDRNVTLFKDLAAPRAYAHVGLSGAGHFVKMVHNGIEYGMMQAIAEGFDILRKSEFSINIPETAELYNHRSVIESRLVGWLAEGYKKYGADLVGVTGSAAASGEGAWTIETAHTMNIPVPVITDALRVRTESKQTPSYQGQVLSVMRNQFGGHSITDTKHV